jgi:hypothetical protein
MFANTATNAWHEQKQQIEPTIDIILFNICEVSFGIPIAKINRVIYNGYLGEDFSLTQNVEILDLHHRLSGISISNPDVIAIFTDNSQQLYGIPLDLPPVLMSIPLDRIRTLPIDFRTSNPLGIASHVAMIANATTELTIFILE